MTECIAREKTILEEISELKIEELTKERIISNNMLRLRNRRSVL